MKMDNLMDMIVKKNMSFNDIKGMLDRAAGIDTVHNLVMAVKRHRGEIMRLKLENEQLKKQLQEKE